MIKLINIIDEIRVNSPIKVSKKDLIETLIEDVPYLLTVMNEVTSVKEVLEHFGHDGLEELLKDEYSLYSDENGEELNDEGKK